MMDNAKAIANKINQELEEKKEYLIFQGKFFYGNRSKEHGILLGIVHIQNAEIIRLNLALSTAHKLRKIEYNSDNKFFIEFFKNVSLKDRSQAVDIKQNLQRRFEAIGIADLLEYSREDFEELMQEIIEDTVQEKIKLKLEYNLRSKQEMKQIYPKLFNQQSDNETEEEEVKLNCEPIIAPINGKKVSDLSPGDEIIANINDSRSLYFKKELEELQEDNSKKTKALINNIDLKREEENIIVQFIPEVYGVITLGEDARQTGIKLAVPKAKENRKINKATINETGTGDSVFTMSIVGLVLLFITLIYFLT
ncbi:hypothetical protein [Halanaerobacter jeridensis]|uniref:Uncharacterized protein n=1 Tax=Halanaerobacter jeridensis TaxID=706427 RepID=A0A939BQS8_9FIRM|nr:hypothetical protein [Halanaerobacter jeridensis]MBM7556674.1 hypothetical protein [Halanaerobacter jeridensis]